jgi:hypothetical protein
VNEGTASCVVSWISDSPRLGANKIPRRGAKETNMRKLILALAAVVAAGAATLVTSAPAAAGAYCLQGRDMGFPGDCSYATYGQCMASASGRGASCNISPGAAYSQGYGYQGYGYQDQPPPPRRGRRAYQGDYYR